MCQTHLKEVVVYISTLVLFSHLYFNKLFYPVLEQIGRYSAEDG